MILGVDLSHFQAAVNFAQLKASGREFVVLKATEGVGYADPSFRAYRSAARAAGLVVGIYHFARDNSPAAEVAYFSGVVGALQTGEFLVLDQEVTHAAGNVPWCSAWLDATRAKYGVAPLIYMNQGAVTGVTSGNWTQVAQTYGLWLAKYDNAPAVQSAVAYWGVPAMKQFYDKAAVPGVPTSPPCDVDSFFGTTAQLLAYGKQAAPAPKPTPEVPDMDANQAQQLADIHSTLLSKFPYAGHDLDVDDNTGHGLAVRADVRALRDAVAALEGKVSTPTPTPVTVDATAFVAALQSDPAALAAIAQAMAPTVAAAVIAQIGAHLNTPPA